MFGRVLGTACVEQGQHLVFERGAVLALADDVVLVEDVAHEVPVVEFVADAVVDGGRQSLEPVGVVAAQGDVEGDDVLDFARMHGAVAHGGGGDGEAVQHGGLGFGGVAFEVAATVGLAEVLLQVEAGFVDAFATHLEDEMMLVAVTVVAQRAGQVLGQQAGEGLQQPVGEVGGQQRDPAGDAVDAGLEGKEFGQPVGAQFADEPEGVLAVGGGDVEGVSVDVFAGDGQGPEAGQHVPPQFAEHGGVVGADVEDGGLVLQREGVEAHGEDGQSSGRAGGFVVAGRVGVEAGG